VRITLGQHFDNNLPLLAGRQCWVNRGQIVIETHIHDTAAHGGNDAAI
jgi:hypothetical protein